MKEVTPQHALFKSGPKVEDETRFRYVFGQRDDPNREVILTVMAFDIPHSDEGSTSELSANEL